MFGVLFYFWWGQCDLYVDDEIFLSPNCVSILKDVNSYRNPSFKCWRLIPTDFLYLRINSLGSSNKDSGLLYTTYSNQNILMFFIKFWYLDLMTSTTLLKFLSASSKDLLNWTFKNYNYDCSSPFDRSSPLIQLNRSGDEGALTEKVAASVLSFLLECTCGEVVAVNFALPMAEVEEKVVTVRQTHLIELMPWSEVWTWLQRHSAQMTWSQRRMVN
jgi:hypothetical protein